MNRRTAAVALLLGMVVAACGQKFGGEGSRPALLLDQVNALQTTVHVGQEFTYAVVLLRSTSDSPVEIRNVSLETAGGDGGVVQAVETMVAPIGADDDWPVHLWSSFPPTAKVGGKCRVLDLEPVEGHTIPPGGAARLVVLFRAVKPGDFSFSGQRVTYDVDGEPGAITLPNHFLGEVTPKRSDLLIDPTERACAKLGNLLPGAVPAGKG